MKISLALIFACILQISANTYAQNTKINLSVSNMKVKEVLKEIESKTNFRFFYNDDLKELDRTLTLNTNAGNIHQILGEMFATSAVSYKILENNVVIIAPAVSFQQQQVTGIVTDATTNEPIIGVTIIIEGTTKGTTTDINGKYTLEITNGDALVFSYLGFVPEKVTYSGQATIDVSLIPDIKSLDEVVVIGYGTVKKRDLTGAVVSIKSTDITSTPTNNTMEALQGKIAGMDILRTSGAVGSNVDILLRGNRSIYGDNTPLFIIDGVSASYNQINPSDIESIDVLKDASSTAIYGSAGANGVVIITTKRGKEGKAIVNLDAYYGISGNAYYKHGMTGEEYIKYQREAYRTSNNTYPNDISEIPLFTNSFYLQAYNDGKWIDWINECIGGTVKQEKYNLSVSGGTEKTKVFTSFNVAKDQGLLSNENQNRYGLRVNLDQTINKWAKMGTSINLTYTVRNARSSNIFTKSLSALPLGDAYNENGEINYRFIDQQVTPLGDQIKDQYANNTKTTYTHGNAYIELTPVKGLSVKSILGGTLTGNRRGLYNGPQSTSNVPITGFIVPTSAIYNNYDYSYKWENIVTYNKILRDHNFTITGITSWSLGVAELNNLAGQGQELDSYLFYNAGAGTALQLINSNYKQQQAMSYAGRFNYSFKGKYLLTVTNRWDGVSRLATGHQWDYFPSFALAWRISDEKFMKIADSWLYNLKLRYGYGVTGNSGGLGPYDSQTGVITYRRLSIGGNIADHLTFNGIYGNPGIGWEKSYNSNFGIDIGLFNNRIDLTIDLYNTNTEGLLYKLVLPATSGISSYGSPLETWQNVGKTNNKGFEITLNTKNIVNKEFQWHSNISYTRNKEKIVSLPEGDKISERLFVGYPVNSHYDYKYLGIWSTEEATEATVYGAQPGWVKVATNPIIDNNGVSDEGRHAYSATDMQILGSTNPKWILGINNSFTYKGFDLSAFSMVRWGQMIESKLLGWYNTRIDQNQPAGTDYWTPENQGAYFPRPNISNPRGLESLKFVDGSYIKIKNITLGYTLPKSILSKIYIDKVRFYFTAYNPIIFTKEKILKGTDPENNGSDTFPLYKTYVFGVNLSF